MKNSAAAVKAEKKVDDFINGDQGGGEITEKVIGAKPVYSGDSSKPSSSPIQSNSTINNKVRSVPNLCSFENHLYRRFNRGCELQFKENQLESIKAAMCKARVENERLKTILAQIVKDYHSLQMHFFHIMNQEQENIKPADCGLASPANKDLQVHHEERELVSLCLGSGSRVMKKQEDKTNFNGKTMNDLNDYQIKQGLTLGLKCKMEEREVDVKNEVQLSISQENSSEGTTTKEETATGDQTWPPSKAVKSLKHRKDDVAPQAQVKRARVSVRARCDAPTMNDGCQWRKYGQKIAKGNPCPRAYYRCTVAPGCPVRKQVQRCAEDLAILITTYEGNHNHPLPISATAMASTTAAAASMLLSASSSTSLPSTASPHSTTGLNFSLPDSSHHNSQFYFTNPSISSSLSQPTITLDLTNPSAAMAYQPNRLFSSSSRSFYSQARFNFSPSESSSSWNSSTGYLSYGSHQPHLKSYNMGALSQSQESLFHSYAHKQVPNPITDTIAKAITSDPRFQSALVAAITSYVGGSVAGAIGEGSSGCGIDGALKWGDQLPLASSLAMATTTTGNSGYLAGSTSSNLTKQQRNLIFYPPSLGPSSSMNG